MKITKTIFFCLAATSLYASTNSSLVIGHRGACGHAPENTLISFEKAIAPYQPPLIQKNKN